MEEEDLFFTLALAKVNGIGPITGKRLIEVFGTAKQVFAASYQELAAKRVSALLVKQIKEKKGFDWVEKELKLIKKAGIQVLFYQAKDYPYYLRQCDDSPLLLFAKGQTHMNWETRNVISVVGTRNPTTRGLDFCQHFVEAIQPYNPIIISGLAYGIDVCIHKQAIAYGLETFGILGHGLHRIYPAKHTAIAEKMREKGGVITEFPIQSKIDRENFIQRNRLVAGMSQATVVVESAIKGGSMSSISFANDYNRDVFAVPGRIDDLLSQGCNELIRTNRAQLLSDPLELVEILNWNKNKKQEKVIQPKLFVNLQEEEQRVYDYLVQVEREVIDLIAIHCNLPIYKVSTILLQLELQGLVRPLPGKYFECLA
ncbi:DNA-processing protein DprA [Myroides sp. DW712]|uniref:DNA-processing protein DprA n=1 Tax=Myroides sp. DW712 TaxID=3389800 RepID=UPI00397BB404